MKLEDLKMVMNPVDLDSYIAFREMVKRTMEYPEWLGDFSKEDLQILLSSGSKIWIYYDKDIPVCSMMSIPADEKTISKFGLNIDYHLVCDYGPMMVNIDYVGNGLQYQMLQALDFDSQSTGYLYAASTVHPDNIYSIRNLEKDGFKQIEKKNFSRGVRLIYFKKFP